MSLFYGKLEAKKQRTLRDELRNHYPEVLHCQQLDLYNTTGIENGWHLIDSFKLKNNSQLDLKKFFANNIMCSVWACRDNIYGNT